MSTTFENAEEYDLWQRQLVQSAVLIWSMSVGQEKDITIRWMSFNDACTAVIKGTSINPLQWKNEAKKGQEISIENYQELKVRCTAQEPRKGSEILVDKDLLLLGFTTRFQIKLNDGPQIVVSVVDAMGRESERKFVAHNAPMPNLEYRISGKLINMKQGLKRAQLRAILISPVPSKMLKETFPDDVRYRATRGAITLVRGLRVLKNSNFSSGSVNLAQYRNFAQPGDRLLIEVSQTIRMKKDGSTVTVIPSNRIINIPIN